MLAKKEKISKRETGKQVHNWNFDSGDGTTYIVRTMVT